MNSPRDIAAFFDFGEDDPGTSDVVRIPLESRGTVPFQLLRRTGQISAAAQAFWDIAAATTGAAVAEHHAVWPMT